MTGYFVNGGFRDPCWDQWTTAGITITHTASTTATVWDGWIQTAGTTATQLYPAWDEWNRTGATRNAYPRRSAPLSAKAQATRDRNRALYARRASVAAMRRRVAERKARALLEEHLDPRQLEQWRDAEEFTVDSEDGKRTYRIRLGLAGNVYLIRDADRPGMLRTTRYCCHVYHPDGRVPDEDNVLTQKLLLEADEDAFLALANLA